MWFSYGWLQAKILSIFQAAFSELSSFFNGRLQITILHRTVFLLQWFCRQLQKRRYYCSSHSRNYTFTVWYDSIWTVAESARDWAESATNTQAFKDSDLRFISVHPCWERLDVMSQQIIWEQGKSGEIAGLVMLPFPPSTVYTEITGDQSAVAHLWPWCSTRCNLDNSIRELTEIHKFWKLKCFMSS